MGLRVVLTRFNAFLAKGCVFITKVFFPNFNIKTHRQTDMFGKKSAISTGVHIFGVLVLEKL